MLRAFSFILSPALILVAFGANADVLRMEKLNRTVVMEEPITMMPTPYRGLTKTQVRNSYGEPQITYPAVGDPPITRWDYEGFHVFFEHNLVLHSVIPNKPLQVDHQDELKPANISELR